MPCKQKQNKFSNFMKFITQKTLVIASSIYALKVRSYLGVVFLSMQVDNFEAFISFLYVFMKADMCKGVTKEQKNIVMSCNRMNDVRNWHYL